MAKMRRITWAAGLLAAAIGSPSLVRAGEPTKGGVAFEAGTPAFADVLAKAKAESRPVFLDFYSDT